jgi:hypothetical protein
VGTCTYSCYLALFEGIGRAGVGRSVDAIRAIGRDSFACRSLMSQRCGAQSCRLQMDLLRWKTALPIVSATRLSKANSLRSEWEPKKMIFC